MLRSQQLWIEALESGEYPQGTGKLQTAKGFCCLGVACAVYEKEHNITLRKNNEGHLYGSSLDSYEKKVKNWLGLRDPIGNPANMDQYLPLADLNDDGISFKEIAAILKEIPEEYFYD